MNESMFSIFCMIYAVVDRELGGNAIAEIQRNKRGSIINLLLTDPNLHVIFYFYV